MWFLLLVACQADPPADTDTDTGPSGWSFSQGDADVLAAIDPALVPLGLALSAEQLPCFTPEDRGDGSYRYAPTCADAAGEVVAIGMDDIGGYPVFPDDGTVVLTWTDAWAADQLYAQGDDWRVSGTQNLVFEGGSLVASSTAMEGVFDGVFGNTLPLVSPFSGAYTWRDFESSRVDAGGGAWTDTVVGTLIDATRNEEVRVDLVGEHGPCGTDGAYGAGAATLTGAQTAVLTWDGETACDGCVPWTLDGAVGGDFCP